MYQFHLTLFDFRTLLLFFQLLRCAVKEPLIEHFAVFLHQLYVPHNIQNRPVFMFHPVRNTHVVPYRFKRFYALPQFYPVLIQNRRRNHVEACRNHFFNCIITQNTERGAVDTKHA